METITVRRASELAPDPADRMRKAMRVSGLGVGEIAERLEVSRNTVSNWVNGHNMPRRRDLRDFCELTGVTAQWIETGILWTEADEFESVTGYRLNAESAPSDEDEADSGESVRPKGFEPPTF